MICKLLSQCGSMYNCLNISVPEIHWHVAGTPRWPSGQENASRAGKSWDRSPLYPVTSVLTNFTPRHLALLGICRNWLARCQYRQLLFQCGSTCNCLSMSVPEIQYRQLLFQCGSMCNCLSMSVPEIHFAGAVKQPRNKDFPPE